MTDNKIFKLNKLEQNDPLQEVLRAGESARVYRRLYFLRG